MAGRGGATSVIDLALELVINEIAQHARLATNATGAAIALMAGGIMVCRAVTGATASEVAALLNAPSGVAEACLATGSAQHCDDTETDPRFDAAACQRLGVRSVVIIPVLSQVVSVQRRKRIGSASSRYFLPWLAASGKPKSENCRRLRAGLGPMWIGPKNSWPWRSPGLRSRNPFP